MIGVTEKRADTEYRDGLTGWLRTSRRRLLALLAVCSAGGLTAGVAWLRRSRPRTAPTPPPDQIVAALVAASAAIIAVPVEPEHYRQFFAWRLAQLDECRRTYRRFGRALAEVAGGLAAFVALSPDERAAMLDRLEADGRVRAELDTVRREALTLFARTDALVHLGYEAWPGTARGFTGLDRPPPSK